MVLVVMIMMKLALDNLKTSFDVHVSFDHLFANHEVYVALG